MDISRKICWLNNRFVRNIEIYHCSRIITDCKIFMRLIAKEFLTSNTDNAINYVAVNEIQNHDCIYVSPSRIGPYPVKRSRHRVLKPKFTKKFLQSTFDH